MHVVPTVHAGRQTRLHTNFTGAQLVGFSGAADDFLSGEKIAFLGEMTAAKRAEAAGLDADIGEIDVAVDDIGYDVADGLSAEIIRRGCHRRKIRTFSIKK